MARWPVAAGAGVIALAALALLIDAAGDRAETGGAGVVAVRAPPASAPAASPPATAASPEALLAPPVAPALADAVAARPDAFVGEWRAPDGTRLSLTAAGEGRYGVTLTGGESDERYDGVLRDGRVHFARGIDGEWVQAIAGAPCVYLGSGTRFCRSA